MIGRTLIGTATGAGLGTLYGLFGRCKGGSCAAVWDPTVPAVVGAMAGLFLVLTSRRD